MAVAPRILNNDPLVLPVPLSAPYYAYYCVDTNNMGTFAHDDVFIFKFIGYNPSATPGQDPYSYDLQYTVNSITQITPSPTYDAFQTIVMPTSYAGGSIVNGWINGTLSHIGTTIIEYDISVTVSLISDPSKQVTSVFRFALNGGVNTAVEWTTDGDLGTIVNGAISELSVVATFGQDTTASYSLVAGSLPPGLELLSDGSISGRVEFQLDTVNLEYNFDVEAAVTSVSSIKSFKITVEMRYGIDADTPPYDTVYVKGLITTADREIVNGLLASIETNQHSNLYRANDRYFGVSKEVRFDHQYGVYSVSAVAPQNSNYFYDDYYEALQQNFYWKYVVLGPLQVAVARDAAGNIIYEAIYSEIIDNLVNAKGQSISKQVGFANEISTNTGPYWTSSETIFTSGTYYDLAPVPKAIASNIVSSANIPVNSVEGLLVGMQMTGYPGVTILNDSNNVPPEIISIDSVTNHVTVNVAQSINFKQLVLFYAPITTSNTDMRVGPQLYPNSLSNMRQQVAESLRQYADSALLPAWMTSQQTDGSILGYVPAWVVCYVKPGTSAQVLGERDTNTGEYPPGTINRYLADADIVLNQLCFEIDRIAVDRSLTYTWGQTNFNTWPGLPPSASVTDDSEDAFINFPRKTILY